MPKPPPRSATRARPAELVATAARERARRMIVSSWASKSASCEPTWTCSPSTSSPRASASSTSARAWAGGRPNFEPWCPVRIASWVSASTPSVTRTSTRFTPGARRERRLVRRVQDDGGAFGRRSPEERLVLVVAVHDDLVAGHPGRAGELELAADATSAPIPSSRSSRISATFANALVPYAT